MNLERISDALQNYTGQENSMRAVADVLQEELGDNWTETVFEDLKSLPPALKDNLTHMFNYYAATMAWNELQEYLADENLQKTPELMERLPILKHWLDFFGAPGQSAYQELENRLSGDDDVPLDDTGDGDDSSGPESESAADEEKPVEEDIEEDVNIEEDEHDDVSDDISSEQKVPEDETVNAESEVADSDVNFKETPEAFEIEKLQKQLMLLDQNQAWLAARCIQLKGIEIYAYPFYGYVVDMMRQVIKGMNTIEENETLLEALDHLFEGGKEAFDKKKEAILHDIELAEQNCESAQTALISEDMDMDEVKRTLGAIDESDTVEYVGPAPDGFELLDDETPLDETAIKKQYEKLENMDAMTGSIAKENDQKTDVVQENTSQNEQKGVQRKLSFSLKRKKPTEGTT